MSDSAVWYLHIVEAEYGMLAGIPVRFWSIPRALEMFPLEMWLLLLLSSHGAKVFSARLVPL